MCHTCIHHNSEYCSSCVKHSYRSSGSYADKNELIRVLVFAIIIASLVPLYYHFNNLSLNTQDFLESLLLVFYFSGSVAGAHYMLKDTDFIDEIRKIPFIGFKLSIILLVIIVVCGIPIFFMLYKLIKILNNHFFKIKG